MATSEMEVRYENPTRLSLTPPAAGAWDRERLFVPELQAQRFGKDKLDAAYDAHQLHRRQEVRSATGPDRERALLMERAEMAGMQHYLSKEQSRDAHPASVSTLETRQDKMERQRSMEQLVSHDRERGHPMHQPGRDPRQPASLDEKRQWNERDGRQLSHEERASIGQQGGFDLFRHRAQALNMATETTRTTSALGARLQQRSAQRALGAERTEQQAQGAASIGQQRAPSELGLLLQQRGAQRAQATNPTVGQGQSQPSGERQPGELGLRLQARREERAMRPQVQRAPLTQESTRGFEL